MSASASANGTPLQRTESFQWPSGHLNHLSEGQLGALDRFRKLCEEKGYYTPKTADGTPSSHDDETLLRYLRARRFVPSEAFAQFKDTEDWRAETQLDNLYETIDVKEYDNTRRLYPQWTGRRDKRGIPLYVYEISHVDAKDVSKDAKNAKSSANSKTPQKMLRLFALYENLCRFVLPLCSAIPNRPNGETPISQSNNIVDISKVGFQKFWALRDHMSDSSRLATAHYPETLDRIFVVGAPSFFKTVWSWAQRWFDPITVSKIFILGEKDVYSTISKYVDPENIPKKYGGTLDWKFGDMPILEPAIADALRWNEPLELKGHRTLPIGPIKWQYDKAGDLVATAIRTENGKPRSKFIAALHPQEGVARLALSPGRLEKTSTIAVASQASAAPKPAQKEKASLAAADTKSAPAAAPSSQEPPPPPAYDAKATDSADADPNKSQAAILPESRAGTYTVPVMDKESSAHTPPADGRQGTSSTRYEQQHGTHAAGEMQDGTPEVKVDSQGEKQGIMEPNTVGQAPKEHPVPEPEEEGGPSLVEQAQAMAGSAVGTALNAIGLGSKAPAETTEAPKPKHDPEIDNMADKNVEEFLRTSTMTQPQPPGN